MPTNGQAVKIAHYTRSKFNSLSNKDSATIYFVEESNGKVAIYVGASQANYIDTIPSVISTTEGNTGTATTQRTINAANLKSIILNHSPAGSRPASDVSSWAKASSKPTYTASEVGARASTWTPTWSQVTSKPSWIGSSKPSYTASEVGAAATSHTHSAATTSAAGFMSASDKSKLNGITAGAQVNRAIATTAQAQAGTDDTTVMTPLKVKQAINASGGGGGVGPIKSGSFQTGIPIGDYSKYSVVVVSFSFSGLLWSHTMPLPDTTNGTKESYVAVVDAGMATQVKVTLTTTTSFDPNYSVLTVSLSSGMFSSVVII